MAKKIKCECCEEEFLPTKEQLKICIKVETITANGKEMLERKFYHCYDCPKCGFRNNTGKEWLEEVK